MLAGGNVMRALRDVWAAEGALERGDEAVGGVRVARPRGR